MCKSSRRRCSVKKGVFKNFAIFTGKHLSWSLFLIKLQGLRPAILLKRDSTQVFSCEYCEIFKNTYFEEHLRRGKRLLLWVNVRDQDLRPLTFLLWWNITRKYVIKHFLRKVLALKIHQWITKIWCLWRKLFYDKTKIRSNHWNFPK